MSKVRYSPTTLAYIFVLNCIDGRADMRQKLTVDFTRNHVKNVCTRGGDFVRITLNSSIFPEKGQVHFRAPMFWSESHVIGEFFSGDGQDDSRGNVLILSIEPKSSCFSLGRS